MQTRPMAVTEEETGIIGMGPMLEPVKPVGNNRIEHMDGHNNEVLWKTHVP